MHADPNRCDRGYVGNTIGQANAVSDRVLDLRQCKFPGANLSGKVLSGALMSEADFTKANLQVLLHPLAASLCAVRLRSLRSLQSSLRIADCMHACKHKCRLLVAVLPF
jgi:uncharacterized protein YjbI with pentapeptide repeats